MKILSSKQIQALDAHTIKNEPILSIDLMERAATKWCEAFLQDVDPDGRRILVIAGMGNNGGDGLVIARLLLEHGFDVHVLIVRYADKGSPDFETNFQSSKAGAVPYLEFVSIEDMPDIADTDVVIDALFGSGLTRPIDGALADLVKEVNRSSATVFAIDMPSGLFDEGDRQTPNDVIVQADRTLTFEVAKLSMLMADNFKYVGEFEILPIGLDKDLIQSLETEHHVLDVEMIRALLKPRLKVAHKGNFGHALVLAGSQGKMGAAVLALTACIRSGAGLTTGHIPSAGLDIVQATIPEAMCSVDDDPYCISQIPDLGTYNSIGMGPGIGKEERTTNALKKLIENISVPLVLDADALNILSDDPDLMALLPKGSIITPHPKEFERMVGSSNSDFERLRSAQQLAKKNHIYVVLKSAYTAICDPKGHVYFNRTGNPGMATGGSGDVLTGMITGLLAQGYSTLHAALIGVYWHGLAGDHAAKDQSLPSMKAGDIIDTLGAAYREMIRK